MKLFALALVSAVMLTTTILQAGDGKNNPFFREWKTPFATPPFKEIKTAHYLSAVEEGIRLARAAAEAVASEPSEPTFANTIEALERSSRSLDKVQAVFNCLYAANTNDEMEKIANTTAPMLSKLADDINLDPKLFARVKKLYDGRDGLALTPEQSTLLKNHYLDFVRGGANLMAADKERLRRINEELSLLSIRFNENLLKETIAIGLVVDNKEDLAGLPEDVVKGASEMAASKGMPGKWAFSLQKPSFIPFLQYSERRALREKILRAYTRRGDNANDNKKVLSRIASLRAGRALLLGYKTHADYVLERNMAKRPDAVYKFLSDVWTPAAARARAEAAEMQKIIDREGGGFRLASWDWWYYAEKVKKEKYDLNEEMLRPYFKMENVRKGAFDVASRLYGIRFAERKDIQVYHPDVKVFEVTESNGAHIGILYTDYYPRDGKRSGAWSDVFRSQSDMDGKFVHPLVYNVGNFAKPTAGKPSLLSVDEVKTLFHEFGHALHALFARTHYPTSQTVFPQDFIELPSQIMENWALDPQVLAMYAKHYRTGKPMSKELIDKIDRSGLFNQGFETVEYLAASFLDMDWHTIADTAAREVNEFEKKSLAKIGLMSEIESRYQSTNFAHAFGGGYDAGYYSYLWAAVLDADAFEAFKEKGIFDRTTAESFRRNVLEKGGSEDVIVLYKRFRGVEPRIDALLKRRGLN